MSPRSTVSAAPVRMILAKYLMRSDAWCERRSVIGQMLGSEQTRRMSNGTVGNQKLWSRVSDTGEMEGATAVIIHLEDTEPPAGRPRRR